MKNKGFTLIELVVAVAVTSILGVILTNLLTQTLRGQVKVRIIDQVKQNGQVSLDKISNEVRQAQKVVCIGTNQENQPPPQPNDTIVLFKNGSYIRFRFYPQVDSGTDISNGVIVRSDFDASAIPTGLTDPMLCTSPQSLTFGQEYNVTDTDTINGISIKYDGSTPIFAKNSAPGYSDTVAIRFKAFQGVKAGTTYESAVGDGIAFGTTVQVRGGKQ